MSVTHGNLLEQLRDLATTLQFNVIAGVSDAVDAGTESAQGTTLFHDVTGRLRRRIVGKKNGRTGEISARTPYAAFVENGTPPHPIAPVRAKVLRFVQNGQVRIARAVQHPGTSPRPFMYEARRVAEQTLEYGIEWRFGEAIRKFNGR